MQTLIKPKSRPKSNLGMRLPFLSGLKGIVREPKPTQMKIRAYSGQQKSDFYCKPRDAEPNSRNFEAGRVLIYAFAADHEDEAKSLRTRGFRVQRFQGFWVSWLKDLEVEKLGRV